MASGQHVEPDSVYKFEFDASSEVFNIQQVGRNITFMKEKVRQFLQVNDSRPFFLYVAFHDPHRNPAVADKVGQFMEKWGDGQPGHGIIPDWTPVHYDPADVIVPYFLPDTTVTRSELANMYTTYSRMDQGIGLFMKELEAAGYLDDTLVMYTSDNGIPYPNAKTNLYEPGMGEPMMISNPMNKQHWGKAQGQGREPWLSEIRHYDPQGWGQRQGREPHVDRYRDIERTRVARADLLGERYTDALASTMDFTPTILDWFGISAKKLKVTLTGKSLLPVTTDPTNVTNYQRAFSSHNFHEVTMNYPMRVVRTPQYRLLHNLNHKSPFGLATDLYQAPTFQDILNKTRLGQSTGWFKTLDQYYYRDQWELYDIIQVLFQRGRAEEDCGQKADVVFIVDSSRSIWEPYFRKQLDFVADVVSRLNVAPDLSHVGVISFSEGARVEMYLNELNDDVPTMLERIKKIQFTAVARYWLLQVFVVGIGHYLDPEQLAEIATEDNDMYVHTVSSFDDIYAALPFLVNQTCQGQKGHFTQIRSRHLCLSCAKSKKADVVFVLDKSSSISSAHFQTQLDFISDMVNVFNVVKSAIHNIKYTAGSTNTFLALELVTTDVLTPKAGARKEVARVVIVVTDGQSSDPGATKRKFSAIDRQ
nr:hypothetical protein BaRGS_005636 [Batillaria attramentaria]